VKVVILQGQIV